MEGLPSRGKYEEDVDKPESDALLEDDLTPIEPVHLHHQHIWSLWGFYSYSFASEVFAIVAIGLFLPITLEQLARDNGYALPNHDSFCHGSLQSTSQPSSSSSSSSSITDSNGTCEVKFLGSWFDTASFPLYIYSFSVAFQAIVVASLGDTADDPMMRKLLLVGFAAVGSLSGMMFFFLDSASSTWSLSAILSVIANVALGVSGVCLNSYIPILARISPAVVKAEQGLVRRRSSRIHEDEDCKSMISKATADISSRGTAIGYGSGIVALGLSLVMITSHENNTDSLRWVIGSSAVWWAVFTIPAALWLSPSWSSGSCGTVSLKSFNPMKSYRQIFSMLSEYNQLKNTIIFLLAWFFLSDAFSTMTSTAVIFGKTSLEMPPSHLILIGLIMPSTGIIGALIAPMVQKNLKYCSDLNGSLKMFKLLVGLSCLVPGYVAIPMIFGLPVLTTEAEMYGIAAVFGLFYGAFQSYARSVYAELIPPGQEAKWYALYSITDKSSSFFGPFVVGLIADYTHNIRYGFVFILIVLLLSFPLLNRVDVPEGKLMAEGYARKSKL